MRKSVSLLTASAALLLCALPVVVAHENEPMENMTMQQSPTSSAMLHAVGTPSTYFTYPEHKGLIYAHVIFMIIGWFFVLPIAVMLSLARSTLVLPAQFSFIMLNALGLSVGALYNNNTPDLYVNNVHHKIGWFATWGVGAQVVVGLTFVYPGRTKKGLKDLDERADFLPVSVEAMAQHQHARDMGPVHEYRWSNDSGQGTERNSASLHGGVEFPSNEDEGGPDLERVYKAEDDDNDDVAVNRGAHGFLRNALIDRFMSRGIPGMLSDHLTRPLILGYEAMDRLILPLGFVLVLSGIVTYGGLFHGDIIFNGLAHFIKGGIFFWYGLLTLGRWMGCFAELGWAWNARPSRNIVGRVKAVMPSAEFTESFVIFFYGCTNVFLEHLAAWGDQWTSEDLEHVSISLMFFGGGLCGMLIESQMIRNLLNAGLITTPARVRTRGHNDAWEEPTTYRVPLNPMPALIILLLGMMMSSHHQNSMLSTMIHKQWGTLFVGFSLARVVTYLLLYISPPISFLPSRPPTELLSAFCLISGGIVFMASNKDTISSMEHHNLNAMFTFTVTMGFTAFLMAWEVIVLAIKGWATRREASFRQTTWF